MSLRYIFAALAGVLTTRGFGPTRMNEYVDWMRFRLDDGSTIVVEEAPNKKIRMVLDGFDLQALVDLNQFLPEAWDEVEWKLFEDDMRRVAALH